MRFAAPIFMHALMVIPVLLPQVILAAEQPGDEGAVCGTFTMHIENDEVGGSDRNYSGGHRLACMRTAPRFLEKRLRRLLPKNAISQQKMSYGLGQNIYTPDDLAEPELIEDDQPYAGWLYVDFGLESEVRSASGDMHHLDNFGLQIGVVGPLSGAEFLQRELHEILGATEPAGWDNQLDNELGANLFYSRQWTGIQRFSLPVDNGTSWLDTDLTPRIGAAVGNIYTYGAGGFMLRIGQFPDDDHGQPAVRPSFTGSDDFPIEDGWSFYLFTGAEGRIVGRNIFLDGNSFDDDSPSVDKNTFVGEVRIGMALAYRYLRLAYTHVYRSQEFEGEEPQTYGAITLSVEL
ncbi:MAG: lipid A deacylase LpxR family protein [Geminicoccaceae bacterium]